MSSIFNDLKRNETLIILCVEGVLIYMGMGQVSPILPLYARQFGVNITMIGLIVTGFAIASAIVDIPAGRIAEILGRRPTLIAGPIILAAGSLGCAIVSDYWLLLACRFVQGAGSALYATAAMIMLADISELRNRGLYMSLYMGSAWVGFGLGPLSGGLIAQFLGLQAVFYVYAFFCLLAAVWAYFRLPETRPPKAAPAADTDGDEKAAAPATTLDTKALFSDPNFILICVVVFFIFFTSNGSRSQIFPLLAHDRLGLNPAQIGTAMTVIAVVNIIVLLIFSRLSDRVGRKPLILPGCILMAVSLVLLVLSTDYWLLILSCVLMGAGIGVAGPTPGAYVGDILTGQKFSTGMGIFRFVSDMGLVVGPVFLGWLSDLNGYDLALLVNCALLLAAAITFHFAAKEHPSFLVRRDAPG
jgi:DHA1 family multidrug resistance protein-like MFS transporter